MNPSHSDSLRKCPSHLALSPLSFSTAFARTSQLAAIVERFYATAYEALDAGDYEQAQNLFAMMAIAAPRDERSWMGLGLAREVSGDWRGAANLYDIGIALAPNSPRCHLGRARAMKQLGRYEDADRSFDAADESTSDPMLLAAIAEERTRP